MEVFRPQYRDSELAPPSSRVELRGRRGGGAREERGERRLVEVEHRASVARRPGNANGPPERAVRA